MLTSVLSRRKDRQGPRSHLYMCARMPPSPTTLTSSKLTARTPPPTLNNEKNIEKT